MENILETDEERRNRRDQTQTHEIGDETELIEREEPERKQPDHGGRGHLDALRIYILGPTRAGVEEVQTSPAQLNLMRRRRMTTYRFPWS